MAGLALVFACIAPHGGLVIPELADGAEAASARTRSAMEEMGRRFRAADPEAVVVITPHGLYVEGALCISACERGRGELGGIVSLDLSLDRALGEGIGRRASAAGLPVALVTASGPGAILPLDWGVVVPLYFLTPGEGLPHPPTVIVTPCRELAPESLVQFGRILSEAAQESGRRVALVASSDLAHAHDPEGPYGFDEAAADFDRFVVEAVRSGELERLLAVDAGFVERAKPDGLWQILILAGALEHCALHGTALQPELLSYEVPTYFGMLCAAYE